MASAADPAATIDDVVARLEAIIEASLRAHSRLGYFAALYNRVTLKVRDGCRGGAFDDGARMERLDVTFANRYLAAYDRYQAGADPTAVWRQAFAAAERDDLPVLQHLLLGMNAHISLDLGIAAARTARGAALDALKDDFFKINDVLASLTATVERENARIDPIAGVLMAAGGGLEGRVSIGFMDAARASAWRLARELAPLPVEEQADAIAARDREAAVAGEAIVLSPLPWLEWAASRDVAENIRILAAGEFDPR